MSGHEHEGTSSRGLIFGLILNTGYTVIEFTIGIITGSLALVADASHNLTDTFTLTVSLIANRYAKRQADERRSFGYGRATILAALLNGVAMLIIAGLIITEAINRLQHPEPISGGIVALTATIGIVVNGVIALRLYRERHDLNMKSAFIDMAFDTLSSLGAVIAGLIILLTDITWVDSVVGLAIAGLLIFNTGKIIKEAINILLEGAPKDFDAPAVISALEEVDGIIAVDDLHAWTIRSSYTALSCHIVVNETDMPRGAEIVEMAKEVLHTRFDINHATIETELKSRQSSDAHEKH